MMQHRACRKQIRSRDANSRHRTFRIPLSIAVALRAMSRPFLQEPCAIGRILRGLRALVAVRLRHRRHHLFNRTHFRFSIGSVIISCTGPIMQDPSVHYVVALRGFDFARQFALDLHTWGGQFYMEGNKHGSGSAMATAHALRCARHLHLINTGTLRYVGHMGHCLCERVRGCNRVVVSVPLFDRRGVSRHHDGGGPHANVKYPLIINPCYQRTSPM